MGSVLLASEVNLVVEAMQGTRNVINAVIPHVQVRNLQLFCQDFLS
jgi:hypothetical protein